MKKRVLVLAPNPWDLEELAKERYRDDYEFIFVPMAFYETHPLLIGLRFDVLKFIAETVRLGRAVKAEGVVGTHDYPASLAAAAVASELGLPGPAVDAALLCHHKYLCRRAQQEAVPDAVPRFGLIDPFDFSQDSLPLEFPFFVKPVKATLSMLAGEARNYEELKALLNLSFLEKAAGRMAMQPFNQMLRAYTSFKTHGNFFIAEKTLRGAQVTVEGFVHEGRPTIMGIVDSVMHPGTRSFQRFEYPSRLAPDVQARMENLAARLMGALGFDDGCFNVEMIYDAGGNSIHIIEVNPRLCTQFSDLYEKVDGTAGYAVQLAIASGRRPSFLRRSGGCGAAASFVLRTFQDKKVSRTPAPSRIRAVRERFPGAVVRVLCREGRWLSKEPQDRDSYRYAILNMGAPSFEELYGRFDAARDALSFEFE